MRVSGVVMTCGWAVAAPPLCRRRRGFPWRRSTARTSGCLRSRYLRHSPGSAGSGCAARYDVHPPPAPITNSANKQRCSECCPAHSSCFAAACAVIPYVQLFNGDTDRARCMEPPYRLLESSADTTVEIELPFWIDHDDVRVKITAADIEVDVRNTLRLKRTFWRNEEEAAKGTDYPGPVDAAESEWSLIDSVDSRGNSCKVR